MNFSRKSSFLLILIVGFLLLSVGCYKGKCYTCRKFAPAPDGEGTYFIGTQKVCPENDNIFLIDPVPGDSTDLWECE